MLNKVNLSYRKTVTYVKSGEVLTKFDREVFESWLKEEVETEDDIEDIERNIDEVIDEYDQRNKDRGWTEVNTTFENTEIGVSDSDYFGEGSFDQSIQMWIDKNKIESLNQKIKQGETK